MLYIFDLDGTVRITKSGAPCPNDIHDQVILPGVKEKLTKLKAQGHILVVASNQGGVSWGYMTAQQAKEIANETNRLLGYLFSEIKLSFWHKAGKYRDKYPNISKPKPDMLQGLMREYGQAQTSSSYVGNQFADQQAAERAGVDFFWAHEFFGWKNVIYNPKGFFPRKWLSLWKQHKNYRIKSGYEIVKTR